MNTEDDEEEIPDGPPAVTVFPWLRCNLGKSALAPLTSTDRLALQAAVHVIDLWNYTGDDKLLDVFAAIVRKMQPKCYRFAYHAIAHVAEWYSRAQVWAKAGLPPIENPGTCKYEPGGSGR